MLRANNLIGWDEDLAKSEVPAIFKRRHKAAFWNGLIPVICFGLIGYFGTRDPSLKSYEFYIFLLRSFVSFGRIFFNAVLPSSALRADTLQ